MYEVLHLLVKIQSNVIEHLETPDGRISNRIHVTKTRIK